MFYDSMISKLMVWDASRDAAIARLRRVLDEYRVVGVKTTVPFFRMAHRDDPTSWRAGSIPAYLDGILAGLEPRAGVCRADRRGCRRDRWYRTGPPRSRVDRRAIEKKGTVVLTPTTRYSSSTRRRRAMAASRDASHTMSLEIIES